MDSDLDELDPLLTRRKSSGKQSPPKMYDTQTCMMLFINYVVGTGCFALPFAFAQAGLGFSTIMLLAGAILCTVSGLYTLEVMARAQGVIEAGDSSKPEHRISTEKHDFSVISQIFGGKILQSVTQVMVFMFGTPWSYAGVFASSMAALIFSYFSEDKCDVYHHPGASCRMAYYILLAAFGTYGISFAMLDVSEQAGMQRFMTMYRGLAIVIMILTLVFKVHMEWDQVPHRMEKIGWFNFAQFAAIFGPAFQALANQYNFPDLMTPMTNKMDAPYVVNVSFAICALFYTLLAVLGALAFDRVDPLVTLNWASYTGCGTGWDPCPQHGSALSNVMVKLIGGFIQILVLCFPVVNVASAYPLVCVTVGDNMSTMVSAETRKIWGMRKSTLSRICRFIAASGPLAVAATFMPLDLIFSVAGIFGFIVALSIPSWLQLASIRYCERKYGPEYVKTPYYRPIISDKPFTWCFFLVSCFCVLLSLVTLKKK